MCNIVIWVVEFPTEGYKIRKIFPQRKLFHCLNVNSLKLSTWKSFFVLKINEIFLIFNCWNINLLVHFLKNIIFDRYPYWDVFFSKMMIPIFDGCQFTKYNISFEDKLLKVISNVSEKFQQIFCDYGIVLDFQHFIHPCSRILIFSQKPI